VFIWISGPNLPEIPQAINIFLIVKYSNNILCFTFFWETTYRVWF
jgi:hypothetical protein